jgi:DNA polymerase-1
MIGVHGWLGRAGVDARMIMQVHDELVFEVGAQDADEVLAEISRIMCGAADLAVALKVDAATGSNWDEAH